MTVTTTPLLSATAGLLLTTTAALAECPTVADMEAGVILAQNEPFFLRGDFKTTHEGFVEMRVIEAGGQVQESMALYRNGLVMTGEHSPSGHVEITYVDDIRPVFQLPEKGEVSISGIAKGPTGEAYVELELTYLGSGTKTLGDCEYETWSLTSKLTDRSGVGSSFRLDYAPELDLVLAADLIGEDGALTTAYAYEWAGKAEELD